MYKYKIITGNIDYVERKLNELNQKHSFISYEFKSCLLCSVIVRVYDDSSSQAKLN